jgi:hypothetical protein
VGPPSWLGDTGSDACCADVNQGRGGRLGEELWRGEVAAEVSVMGGEGASRVGVVGLLFAVFAGLCGCVCVNECRMGNVLGRGGKMRCL